VRKQYAVAGVVVAVLVATLIVVAGTRSSGNTPTASATVPKGADMSLPPGHPSIGPSSSSSPQAEPDADRTLTILKAKYKKDPGDTKTILALADAYLMNERPAKARALYAKVLKREPDNEQAKVQYAMALHATGNDEQAFALLGKVIKSDPQSQLAHYNLAILYFSDQQSDQAKSEWRKAAAIDPTTSIGRSAANFVNLMEDSTGAPHPSSTP